MGYGYMAIVKGKNGGVLEIREQISSLVVVDVQTLLLNQGIRRACVKLKTGRQSNRAKWTVQGNRSIIGLGHSRDLLDLRNPSGMGRIRLNNINVPFLQQMFEIPAGIESFAGGERDRRMAGDLAQDIVMLRQHRFFEK